MFLNLRLTTKQSNTLAISPQFTKFSKQARNLDLKVLLLITCLLQTNSQAAESRQVEQGFTLLECLVAILIISISLVAITPPIFFATATRAQSRRAEQGLQIAQAEVDRVRTVVERGFYNNSDLPEKVDGKIEAVAAPTGIENGLGTKSTSSTCTSYNGTTVSSTKLLPVDTDGDCKADFLVQTFRTGGPAAVANPNTISGFKMGVRVYVNTPLLQQNLNSLKKDRASLKFTNGIGGQYNKPIATLYSTIVRNDTPNALTNYKDLCTNTNVGC